MACRYAKIRIADTVNGKLLDGCETVTYESTLKMHDFFVVPGLYEISLTLLEPLTVRANTARLDLSPVHRPVASEIGI